MGMRESNIWLVDAVRWDTGYLPNHPLRSVRAWFQQHFPRFTLQYSTAEDLIEAGIPANAEKIILSGSPRDAWDNDPFTLRLAERVREISERQIRFLGVCYGHQMLARALGGEVQKEKKGLEFGNATVNLTPAGSRSALFRDLPETFSVLQSHSDAVTKLPPSAQLLATGEHTHVQAFQHGSAMFGVQFHPETTPEILRYLWEPRVPKWQPNLSYDLHQKLNHLFPAKNAVKILQNFSEL
ncbi:MAG: glutamine amidotransferase [Verrucomicrobiales bacterium]|nr:glutamine amidotransferase [Verrucomicrobiales bacterium]